MAAGAGLGAAQPWAEGQSDGLWQTIREGAAQSAGSAHEVPANPSVAFSTEQQTRPVGQSSGPSHVMAASGQVAVQMGPLDIMVVAGQQEVVAAVQTAMPQRISPAAGTPSEAASAVALVSIGLSAVRSVGTSATISGRAASSVSAGCTSPP